MTLARINKSTIEYDAKSQYDSKLDFAEIDKAFSFYNLDEKYKQQVYICVQKILNNHFFKNKFFEVYETLFVDESDKFRELWKIKDTEVLFGSGVHPFVTNLMILLGASIHKAKMKARGFNRQQIATHKARIKECFLNDLEKRKYKGIRISQMLWASYFINCRIIEVGILQYEYDHGLDKIKIHIPHLPKLDFDEVKKSLIAAKMPIKKYFHLDNKQYICNSWLLSKQLAAILDNESNIRKFQSLFEIKAGEDCTGDILNFVYNLRTCEDYEQLPENTSLQRKIKVELKQGRIFRLGCGEFVGFPQDLLNQNKFE